MRVGAYVVALCILQLLHTSSSQVCNECHPMTKTFSDWQTTACFGNFHIRYRICDIAPAANICANICSKPYEINVEGCSGRLGRDDAATASAIEVSFNDALAGLTTEDSSAFQTALSAAIAALSAA